MRSFFSPHIILGVGKQRDLENKIFQIVGDALIGGEVIGVDTHKLRQ
jgi:hypothetical protein